jgi:uncharacterized protein involved in outer membrane biogenesis
MDSRLVYVKTPIGDEAVRQSTHVVERKLRMVLVQVDGKLNVAEMAAKMGNVQLVEGALKELEEGGFIVPSVDGVSVWEEGGRQAGIGQSSDLSEFSTFGQRSVTPLGSPKSNGVIGKFSSFGKSILPTYRSSVSEVAQAKEVAEPTPAYGVYRRLRSFLKWFTGGLICLAGLLFGLMFFYPLADKIPAIEASVSSFLQVPVRIEHIGLRLSPWPQLVLRNVSLGEEAGSRINEIRVHAPISQLWGRSYRFSTVEVSGAAILANQLAALPFFNLASSARGSNLSIEKIRFSESQVIVRELALRDISGEIQFGSDGSFENGAFQAVDRSIRLVITPVAEGIALNIDGTGWRPVGKSVSFDSLRAKGLLQKDKLLIENLDTTFLGGILRGNWLLDWRNGLVLAGDATLSGLDCRKVSEAFAPLLKLEGSLGGSLGLRAGGKDWESMWRSVELTLEAEVKRGAIYGIDLGEAARRGVGSVARAGKTKFERLRTVLIVNPHLISARDFQLDAGVMTASGQFLADRDLQIDGNLTVGFGGSTSTPRIPIRISGTLPDLLTVAGK